MLVNLAVPCSDAPRSEQGFIFQRNRAGFILKNKAIPIRKPFPTQQLIPVAFKVSQSYYPTLPPTLKSDWILEGASQVRINRCGISYSLSGIQYFSAVNIVNVNEGNSIQSIPP